jgi:hypothetical protein
MSATLARRVIQAAQNDPVCLALRELEDTDEAVALAKIAAEARAQSMHKLHPSHPHFATHWTFKSYDLERDDLPSTAEIIDRLAAERLRKVA